MCLARTRKEVVGLVEGLALGELEGILKETCSGFRRAIATRSAGEVAMVSSGTLTGSNLAISRAILTVKCSGVTAGREADLLRLPGAMSSGLRWLSCAHGVDLGRRR